MPYIFRVEFAYPGAISNNDNGYNNNTNFDTNFDANVYVIIDYTPLAKPKYNSSQPIAIFIDMWPFNVLQQHLV